MGWSVHSDKKAHNTAYIIALFPYVHLDGWTERKTNADFFYLFFIFFLFSFSLSLSSALLPLILKLPLPPPSSYFSLPLEAARSLLPQAESHVTSLVSQAKNLKRTSQAGEKQGEMPLLLSFFLFFFLDLVKYPIFFFFIEI